MSAEAIDVLEYQVNERFSVSKFPDHLNSNPFVSPAQREKLRCPECKEYMEIRDLPEGAFYACRQLHKLDVEAGRYYHIDTKNAVRKLIEEIQVSEITRSRDVFIADSEDGELAIVPGKYKDRKLGDLAEYLRENRNLFVISFNESTRQELEKTVGRFGGISMVVSPPEVKRKYQTFCSIVLARDRLESSHLTQSESVPVDLVKKVHDNPQYVVNRLVNFQKIPDKKALRDEMEQLCSIAFSHVAQFPLRSLGMNETGTRIPDGLGFIFDENHRHRTMVMLDSKSVSAETRDYPKIDEGDGPQYRKYLEISSDICVDENVDHKVLVFIAAEFHESKIHDFLDELARTKFDDFIVVFMNLSAVSTLLLCRTLLAPDRAVRLNRGQWQDLLQTLFVDPVISEENRNPTIERKGGFMMSHDIILEHLENSITDQKNKDELLGRVVDKFIEYSPHDPEVG